MTARRAGVEPEVRHASGGSCEYLATGGSTGGGFGLYRWNMVGPGGPGPHFHRSITESFYVLDGEIELYDGTQWVRAGEATSSSCRRAGSTASATPRTGRPRC